MISYNVENGAVRMVPRVDPGTNRQITSPENMINVKVAGASLYVPLNPLSWWEMTNNLYINNAETNFNLAGNDLIFRSWTCPSGSQKGCLCSPGPTHSAAIKSGHQGTGRQERKKKEEDYR